MCGICGCTEEHDHNHPDATNTITSHHHPTSQTISIEQNILAKNNQFALENRRVFSEKKITAFNFMSSPGSGKTTLLTKTITKLKETINIAVVVGDQQTDYDARRLQASGVQAIQVNTGKVCHLDAHMVGHALDHLQLDKGSFLFIENIGNLVCPALFDLGETYKIVILSVTEGDNKPLKYPEMFRGADLMILTKTDLLPYVEFDINQSIEYATRINPSIKTLQVSATQGEGLTEWYQWLKEKQR